MPSVVEGLIDFFFVTVSFCCTHVTSTIYCCVISVTVIHAYYILLCLWYLAYLRFIYVAIVSIEMCLSINDVSVMVNTK
jgi:hypothetical protein